MVGQRSRSSHSNAKYYGQDEQNALHRGVDGVSRRKRYDSVACMKVLGIDENVGEDVLCRLTGHPFYNRQEVCFTVWCYCDLASKRE